MDRWDDIVTDRTIKLSDVQNFLYGIRDIRLFNNRFHVAATSGSTGGRGVFIYNSREWLWVLASYIRAADFAGIKTGITNAVKIAIVSTTTPWHQSALVGASLRSRFAQTLRIDAAEPLKEIVRKLNAFNPLLLIGYPSVLKMLAEEKLSGALDISPEYIFSAAEVLLPDTRRVIKNAWGVQAFDVYGSTETGGIASECAWHGLHLYEDLVITEVVDENHRPVVPGKYGAKLLVTVLWSRLLPLIRYELDDRVMASGMACPCGRPFALIDGIEGRLEEVIELRGENSAPVKVHPNFFHNILEAYKTRGWQVVKERGDKLRISILRNGGGADPDKITKAIKAGLDRQKVRGTAIEVTFVDSLDHAPTGKIILIKSLKQPDLFL
ncbi:MAG: phenylacetate--CoA ligase family protein [Deltaproteobacteria bacterium]|nr:phenylacetate--CoA ligase family protein [Deltaproteobacteria bacterium]